VQKKMTAAAAAQLQHLLSKVVCKCNEYFAKLKIKELNFCKAISKLNNIAHSSKGR
jgi:hypothetical protein